MEIWYYTPWAKQKKNGTPLFWAEVTSKWYDGAIVLCFRFYFSFRNYGIGWDRLPLLLWYIFFSKVQFLKYLITAVFKVLSQQLWGILTAAFERQLKTKDFTDMARACTKTFWLIIVCFPLAQTNLVFKFNLILIE